MTNYAKAPVYGVQQVPKLHWMWERAMRKEGGRQVCKKRKIRVEKFSIWYENYLLLNIMHINVIHFVLETTHYSTTFLFEISEEIHLLKWKCNLTLMTHQILSMPWMYDRLHIFQSTYFASSSSFRLRAIFSVRGTSSREKSLSLLILSTSG
jgi:hypothetical protein